MPRPADVVAVSALIVPAVGTPAAPVISPSKLVAEMRLPPVVVQEMKFAELVARREEINSAAAAGTH